MDVGLSRLQGIFMLVQMSVAEMEAVIKASPGGILVLVKVSEIFPLNLMVPELSLLGGISCGF